ncbi:NADAR family protein [Agrobacterium rubi]|nr:NADAR family protein [Agrobacterium rubi]NTF25030.1 NADAR family protein [Agrobacterium rubi]
MIKLSDFKMRVTPTQVLFWGGPASQWYKSDFEGFLPVIANSNGRRSIRKDTELRKFSSAEKYMMMAKASVFGDRVALKVMEDLHDVKKLKAEGRNVVGFDPEVWDAVNIPIVTIGTYYKATQNDGIWAFINEMGDREYVEGSPVDRIWGVGLEWSDPKIEDRANWRGENRLGVCWENAWDMVVAVGRDADPFLAYGQVMKLRNGNGAKP